MFASGLYGHIVRNNIKSAMLLSGFVILLGLLWMAGTLIWAVLINKFQGIIFRLQTSHQPTQLDLLDVIFNSWSDILINFAFIPAILIAAWFAIAYVSHGKLLRKATGARAISRQLDRKLYNAVENLAITAGLPVPRVEIMETPALNAYAAGLGPGSATVAVTRG